MHQVEVPAGGAPAAWRFSASLTAIDRQLVEQDGRQREPIWLMGSGGVSTAATMKTMTMA